MILSESIGEATVYLERHGVTPATHEAELLHRHVLGLARVQVYSQAKRPLTSDESDELRGMLERRGEGWPLQYITREADFMGMTFEVAPGVFIPRPETEVLVERALEVTPSDELEILDIGTGCGNIAVSMARARPEASVTATDVGIQALGLCSRNARRHMVDGRVTACACDLFRPLEEGKARGFDVIVSNPPYVPDDRWDGLPVEVREFEPREALLAGPRGLDVITRIIEGAAGHLKGGGWLVLEVDESHAAEVLAMLDDGWCDSAVFRDLLGRDRVVRAAKSDA